MTDYECSNCGLKSKVKGNIKRHISNLCEGAELIENVVKLQCDICDKEYNTEISLNVHKKGCVAKKAVVVKEYIDTAEVIDKIKSLTLLINSLLTSNEQVINENKDLKKRLEKLEKIDKKEENIEDIDYKATCQYTRNKGPRVENRNQIFKYFGWDTDESRKRCEFLVNDRVESGLIHMTYIEANGIFYIFDSTKKKKNEKNVTDLIIYDPEDCTKRAKKYSNKHAQCCCLDHLSYYE